MAKHKIGLALAFLQSHPDAAANLLEQLPIAEVSDFFNNVPSSIAAPVLERMLPQYTARLCKLLLPAQSAANLSLMNFSVVSAVLRHIHIDLRQQLIELLPEKMQLGCLLLLNYTEDTVGAWMLIQATSISIDNTAGQALKSITEQGDLVFTGSIFVVDRARHLQGELSLSTLFRTNPETAISTLLQSDTPVLLGRTHLESAIQMELWEHRDSVAIINRQNQFVGVLRHLDLRRGLLHIASTIESPIGSDPITSILSVYGSSLVSLLDTVGEFASIKNN